MNHASTADQRHRLTVPRIGEKQEPLKSVKAEHLVRDPGMLVEDVPEIVCGERPWRGEALKRDLRAGTVRGPRHGHPLGSAEVTRLDSTISAAARKNGSI
ncbi:MAG: hypothetical protein R3F14_45235 [Polyangiaceae bacterium]